MPEMVKIRHGLDDAFVVHSGDIPKAFDIVLMSGLEDEKMRRHGERISTHPGGTLTAEDQGSPEATELEEGRVYVPLQV